MDNLCQFLAQDRVSEFARLTPKELLLETEKAIEDDQLYKWHQFLIDEGEKASNSQNEIENLKQALRQNQNEVETLQRTIEQFASKKKMEEEMKNYQALHEWTKADMKHKEYKAKLKQSRKLKKRFEKKKADIGPLKKEQAKWNRKKQTMDAKHQRQMSDLKKADRRRIQATKKLQVNADEIRQYEDKIKQANQDLKAKNKRIKKIQEERTKLQQHIDKFDHAEIERAKEEKHSITRGGLKEARGERNKVEQQLKRVLERKQNIEHNVNKINYQLDMYTNTARRKEAHIFGNNRVREKAFKMWVDGHRHEFQGEIFGPIVQEMTVRNDLHAKFLNALIGQSVFYGYVCTHPDDWNTLLKQAGKHKLQVSIFTSANGGGGRNDRHGRRPVDHSTLAQYGVDGYLDEIFEAPDIIKTTLNDNLGFHQRAYCMRDPRNDQLDNILVTTGGQQGRLKSLVTPSAMYTIKESRYSTNVMRVMGSLIEHRNPILIRTEDFTQKIAEENRKKNEQITNLEIINGQIQELVQQKKSAVAEVQRLNDKKKECESKITAFLAIQNKLVKKTKDLEELEKDNASNPKQIELKLTKDIQEKNLQRITTLEKLAQDFEYIHKLMQQTNACLVASKHFNEEQKHIQNKIRQINKYNQELRKAYDESKKDEQKLKNAYDQLINQANHRYPRRQFCKKWTEDDKKLDLDEIMDKINHLQGRINVLFIDEERVNRYHRLQKKIDSQSNKLRQLENAHRDKADEIKNIENMWKPQLTQAVAKISSKFGEFFNQFNHAQGKIELVSENIETRAELKYSEWCIDILTKFRNDQPWKRLTSSSQSGGEKSVSTMLYLLSLQEVTTVPFRVVDEINQGMDPINERRIMQILNFECTPKRHHRSNNNYTNAVKNLPQYFVVTPKLLPRLEYSPCSSVYVIFNGPFQMPQEYWELNKFVSSQKALSASPPKNGKKRNRRDNMDNDDDDEEDDDDNSDKENDDETDSD